MRKERFVMRQMKCGKRPFQIIDMKDGKLFAKFRNKLACELELRTLNESYENGF